MIQFLAVLTGMVLGQLLIWIARRVWVSRAWPRARGADLNHLGMVVNVPRFNGESDLKYRRRIIARLAGRP